MASNGSETAEAFPQPQSNRGGKPCGECHIQADETCDICGATELPPGFRVLNDGQNREVLIDDRTDDPAPVFTTRAEAAAKAWEWWREIYQSEDAP